MRASRDGNEELANASIKNILPAYAPGARNFTGFRKDVEAPKPAKASTEDNMIRGTSEQEPTIADIVDDGEQGFKGYSSESISMTAQDAQSYRKAIASEQPLHGIAPQPNHYIRNLGSNLKNKVDTTKLDETILDIKPVRIQIADSHLTDVEFEKEFTSLLMGGDTPTTKQFSRMKELLMKQEPKLAEIDKVVPFDMDMMRAIISERAPKEIPTAPKKITHKQFMSRLNEI